jgi:hypothetical protein
VTYVTDQGFLIPTLVSAGQVRRQVSDIADVVVAVTGLSQEDYGPVAAVISDLGLVPIHMDHLSLPEGAHWNAGHVPISSLGRFFLPAYLPARYRHVVYIDGDTQITGDVRPLVLYDVPEGFVAVAPDCGWMRRYAWLFKEEYLRGLGLRNPADYFNAGVLAFARPTLESTMREAMDFFLANSTLCRFHDQSALNAVMRDRKLWLSPRYNFLAPYRDTGLERIFEPVIRHFNGPEQALEAAGIADGRHLCGRLRRTGADLSRADPLPRADNRLAPQAGAKAGSGDAA